jgi:probable rRNA maturation factor
VSRDCGSARLPAVALHDHQSLHALDLNRIEAVMQEALPLVLTARGPEDSVFAGLEEIEVSFLDDAGIARVHGEFLGDPTPTDVISFDHGEILVSAETAAREAAARGEPISREVALYLIHGLLHLHGHTDTTEPDRATMHAAQERILAAVWPAGDLAKLPP